MQITPLLLNPRYWKSGFRTQASNIKANKPLAQRKLACLLETISSFILKHGHTCFASSDTLARTYNENCHRYGCKPIIKRTIDNYIKIAKELGLIAYGQLKRNDHTGQNQRHITLCVDGIQKMFTGAYKYALQAAEKFCNRQKLHLGGASVEKPLEASSDKAFEQSDKNKNCSINTKDLSTESKNKINNGIPSDSWFLKIFKRDADEVKQLQLAAKQGRLSASGARRVIKLYNKHQQPLAPKFVSYLKFVIASWHNKAASAVKASVNKVRDTATILAEYMTTISEKESQGLVEYYRDAVGRVQIRYL
ncbi:hypothetical protein ACJO2A_19975 [Vibrio parahaemolyticus]|uniref:hypothetical protein n=1 Tax=Vibrio parahaemolyticus TaxID=670 RepID=UPI0011246F24|nr:hypothetical protein [Vibrio parahaemolyticus]MBE4080471.1 hypothetical protein [Vibrio parahaemolyticus]TOJ25349.1 hypothetical protein CGI43_20495 [Vibrio parahaemolyticus]